ncbi:hypothetical protein CC80DRAFT_550499 [Byssothecium circinans]|uniref:SRR1-like domain-containing protein n=1 Tax=Byssothecium circinans TaxID=147558 RepID=A0A6A5TMV1_9PLEO|nr:hypothetical protein CC80DRAFT_550499 [Byssothecium circinans]
MDGDIIMQSSPSPAPSPMNRVRSAITFNLPFRGQRQVITTMNSDTNMRSSSPEPMSLPTHRARPAVTFRLSYQDQRRATTTMDGNMSMPPSPPQVTSPTKTSRRANAFNLPSQDRTDGDITMHSSSSSQASSPTSRNRQTDAFSQRFRYQRKTTPTLPDSSSLLPMSSTPTRAQRRKTLPSFQRDVPIPTIPASSSPMPTSSPTSRAQKRKTYPPAQQDTLTSTRIDFGTPQCSSPSIPLSSPTNRTKASNFLTTRDRNIPSPTDYGTSVRSSSPNSSPVKPPETAKTYTSSQLSDLELVRTRALHPNFCLEHFITASSSLNALVTTGKGSFYAYGIHDILQSATIPPQFQSSTPSGQAIAVKPAPYHRTVSETAGITTSTHNTKVDTKYPQGRNSLFWITGTEQEVDGPDICCGLPSLAQEVRIQTGKHQSALTKSHLKPTLTQTLHVHKTLLYPVTKVLCVGLGDFIKSAACYASLNHLIALTIFNEISAIQFSRKKTPAEQLLKVLVPQMRLLAQDAEYCATTRKVLEGWGFEVLEGAAGFKAVDGNTFVMSFNSTSREPVSQIVTGLAARFGGPAALLCNAIDEGDEALLEAEYARRCSVEKVGKMFVDVLPECARGEQERLEIMGDVRLYFRGGKGDEGREEGKEGKDMLVHSGASLLESMEKRDTTIPGGVFGAARTSKVENRVFWAGAGSSGS